MPSRQYDAAVAEGRAHHGESKTYSGSLMRVHVPFLTDLIERLGVRSALDYGCGKGVQYRWQIPEQGGRTIEQLWGFEVRKYDPCWPPYAHEPPRHGQFDLVICTHTLALIPLADLNWVLDRLYGFAGKAVFIAEKIGERKKREVAQAAERPIGWTVGQWLDRIAPWADQWPLIESVFSSRERIGDATITTRWTRRQGSWSAQVAGPR